MTARQYVVDASAVVEVMRESDLGRELAEMMSEAVLVAPAHLDAEVLSAMGRLVRGGTLGADAVTQRVAYLDQLPVRRHPLPPLVRQAWALRDVVALRDALYVACTEAVDGVLLTLDRRLARSAPVEVELIG
ncbi:MAG: type II toxin-antitoxin system VapC family toxin [Nitriliruptorales bacterium]|nr:type II toxin-antitoxin system VapC family toxin [Nitriliruptorales bacterium]